MSEPKKFTGQEIIDSLTDLMIEMNGKFQKKPRLMNKDLTMVGYVSMAIQRLEKGVTPTPNTSLDHVYDDETPDAIIGTEDGI